MQTFLLDWDVGVAFEAPQKAAADASSARWKMLEFRIVLVKMGTLRCLLKFNCVGWKDEGHQSRTWSGLYMLECMSYSDLASPSSTAVPLHN